MDGYEPVRELNCIVACVNREDPSDRVDAIVLHKERFQYLCCTVSVLY